MANVQWEYFSPTNSHNVSQQKKVTHADKLQAIRDKILKTHASFNELKDKTDIVVAKSTLSTEQDVIDAAQDAM